MNKVHHCVTSSGEHLEILQNEENYYLCPVCGSAEFKEPPYNENGEPSFQMCSCEFEFGFDDSNLATTEAEHGIKRNWERWRLKVIEKNKHSKKQLELLEANLANIGYRLAFDLLPCLLYTSPSPRDATLSRMPSSA